MGVARREREHCQPLVSLHQVFTTRTNVILQLVLAIALLIILQLVITIKLLLVLDMTLQVTQTWG